MSEDAIARVRRLLAAATPGPWFTVEPPWVAAKCPTWVIAGNRDPHRATNVCMLDIDEWEDGKWEEEVAQVDADMRLIATARNILPAMCDVIDAAREVQAGLFPMDVPWEDGPMMLERLRKALAALDRAAEEGGEGGE